MFNVTSEVWLEVFKNGAGCPLQVTRHACETKRYWHHDLTVYIFDPTRPTDLIDLWNLRLEPHPVLPVPIDWFENLADHIREIIKAQFRPVKGNPNGIMHHATVEFGRSIGKERSDVLIKTLGGLPVGSLYVKLMRNCIWQSHTDERIHRDERLEVTADEQQISIDISKEQKLTAKFQTLDPDFASRFGGHGCRWINAVMISGLHQEEIATVLPFNVFDRHWPQLVIGNDWVTVGNEGWIFGQSYKNWSVGLTLLSMDDAIIGSLNVLGIQAKLSDPGHVAKQMLDHLGGLWDVYLLADLETIQLLNNMAGGIRRRTHGVEDTEETFERRSAAVKKWADLISRRKKHRSLPRMGLDDFTRRNIIRLGLETECPHCHVTNWHSLTTIDYSVTCERCLNRYEFPQAGLRKNNQNWYFRVIGPFSVPDFGRGSYSALLTLRVIRGFGSHAEMTFSTAMSLKFDGIDAEADFVAWHRQESHGTSKSPHLIIGEAKSLGQGDLIKPKDLSKLKAIGRKLPGAFIVISVLREHFTDTEKELLRNFVRWGRRPDEHGRPTNPVILLTAHELFFDFLISSTWEKLGGIYKTFADYEHTHNLYNFADATQIIYLGLPAFHEWRAEEYKKRYARNKRLSKTM